MTPWTRGLTDKLKGPRLVRKFTAFYGTRVFITAFKTARHQSLCWARTIQFIAPLPTSRRSILILYSHLQARVFQVKIKCGNTVLFNNYISDVAKLLLKHLYHYYSDVDCHSQPSGCKCPLSPVLHQNILTEFSYDRTPALIPYKNCPWVIFLLSWRMLVQNNYVTPATSQHYVWHPVTNKF